MTNKFVAALRWPEDKRTGRVPWFVALRRLIFWVPLWVSLSLAWVVILAAYGIDEARMWWRDAT